MEEYINMQTSLEMWLRQDENLECQILRNNQNRLDISLDFSELDILLTNIILMNYYNNILDRLTIKINDQVLSFEEIADYTIGYPPDDPLGLEILEINGVLYYIDNKNMDQLISLLSSL